MQQAAAYPGLNCSSSAMPLAAFFLLLQVSSWRVSAETATKEKDFYYSKLRAIELLCNTAGVAGSPVSSTAGCCCCCCLCHRSQRAMLAEAVDKIATAARTAGQQQAVCSSTPHSRTAVDGLKHAMLHSTRSRKHPQQPTYATTYSARHLHVCCLPFIFTLCA